MSVTRDVIEGPYLQDLLEQPAAIERTLRRLRATPAVTSLAADLTAGRFRRIVLTGMGSSLFALHPLHLHLTEAGHVSQMVETSELIHFQSKALDPNTLLVVVSQSGRSAEIVSLLDQRVNGATIVGVTNYADSPLATKAHIPVLIAAGDEHSVSCKTYLASLVALKWLAGAICGDDNASTADLDYARPAVHNYLVDWRAHVNALTDRLRATKHIFLAGRGESLAASRTGGLILKESAHFPAEGMSSAAFRHGPMEMLSPSVLVVVFGGSARASQLNVKLASDIRQGGGEAELVDFDVPIGPFRLPAAPQSIRPILELLPVQMISLALAARDGREAGRFEKATKVTDIE